MRDVHCAHTQLLTKLHMTTVLWLAVYRHTSEKHPGEKIPNVVAYARWAQDQLLQVANGRKAVLDARQRYIQASNRCRARKRACVKYGREIQVQDGLKLHLLEAKENVTATIAKADKKVQVNNVDHAAKRSAAILSKRTLQEAEDKVVRCQIEIKQVTAKYVTGTVFCVQHVCNRIIIGW